MKKKYLLYSEQKTKLLAECIAQSIQSPMCFYFNGGLGVGKTTLIRYILRFLGIKDIIPSPTYTIIEEYKCNNNLFIHMDLYRIDKMDELLFLGLQDYDKKECSYFIEWPKHIQSLPKPDIILNLDVVGGTHSCSMHSYSDKGARVYNLVGEKLYE